ncbi:MAG: hypothetical protein WCT10_02810 [Patescibacteria group bacterium]|jgi:hypothetical protein
MDLPGSKTKFRLSLALGLILMFAPFAAAAQAVDLGLVYAQSSGLPNLDIRMIATALIRCLLGLAGFILVLQILKGGFLLMTQGSSADGHDEAVEVIKSGIFGFILVGISSSLTDYIVRTVADAAGMVITNYL